MHVRRHAFRPLVWTLILSAALSSLDPAGVSAHVVGTQPLTDRGFHNDVSAEELPRWEDVLSLYYGGRLEEAADRLRELIDEGAVDEANARRNLAVILKDLGDYAGAVREYERLTELEPGEPHLLIDLGFAHLASGSFEEAAHAFESALGFDNEETLAHFGLALALIRLGDETGAARSLTRAILLDERLAVAWEALGNLHFDAGRHQAAATAFETVLRLDPSYLRTYFDLARAYEKLGRVAEAWNYYEQSSRIFGGDEAVQAEVERFVEENREIVLELERADDERERPQHVVVTPVPHSESRTDVRVGLAEGAESLTISAGASFRLAAQSETARLSKGVWNVRLEEGVIEFTGPSEEKVTLSQDGDIRLTLDDPTATWIVFDLQVGQGYFWAREDDRQVRGDLIVFERDGGLTLVNALDLQEYLAAVVPSEMYPNMHIEALKAQAIAARTYTLRNLGRYSSRGFDVRGSVSSSEYRGVDREYHKTTQAVIETAGQVLTYDGRLIEAFYNASAGGYTASSEAVWGGKRAYLQNVPEWAPGDGGPDFPLLPSALEYWLKHIPDVYSSRSRFGIRSTFRWIYRVDAEEIRDRVPDDRSIGRILRIVPGPRSESGYLESVTIVGTEGTYEARSDSIRSRLGGLKSNAFKVEAISGADGFPESFIFYGSGFGHGVGLSQFGAAGMAETGSTAEEILHHYFPGTNITTR